MDIKRLLTPLLIGLIVMLAFQYFTRGKNGAAGAGGAMELAPFAYYQHLPDLKAPEDYKNREGNATPDTKVLGDISSDSKSDDRLTVTVNNITAGIDQVQLRDYAQSVGSKDRLVLFRSTPGLPKPFSTMGIHIRYNNAPKEIAYGVVHEKSGDRAANYNDSAETIALANSTNVLDMQYVWKFESSTARQVVMSMRFDADGKPLVKVFKTIEISPDSYDVKISHTVENDSGAPLEVGIDQLGAAELPRDDPQSDDRYFMGMPLSTATLSVSEKSLITITHQQMPKALAGWRDEKSGEVRGVGTVGVGQMADYKNKEAKDDPIVWIASSNRFFASIIRPVQESTSTEVLTLTGMAPARALYLARHVSYASLDLVKVDHDHPEDNVAMIRLHGAMMPIPAGAGAEPGRVAEPLAVFLGPKKEPILRGSLVTPASPTHPQTALMVDGKLISTKAAIHFTETDGQINIGLGADRSGAEKLVESLNAIAKAPAGAPSTAASRPEAAGPRFELREVLPADDNTTPAVDMPDPESAGQMVRVAREDILKDGAVASAAVNAPAASGAEVAIKLTPAGSTALTQAVEKVTPEYLHAAYSYIKIIQFNTCYLYTFCVFDPVVFGILWLLDGLTKTVAFHNYGIAIMILVIIVRAALHPLTRASQINMAQMGKKMRDIQPKLDAIKKKYPDSREKQSQETMRVYRENKVNPAGGIMGCLPMALQLPIWGALMSGLRLDIDLRHASFIPGWINDLSNPDQIFPLARTLGHPLVTIPLLNFPIYGLNPLPILLAAVLFINMKVTMASQPKPADENQANAQKWSQYSIFMLPFFLYNAPSGSNLYFFASTMGGLVDTYFVRKALKKKGILPASAKDLPTKEPEK